MTRRLTTALQKATISPDRYLRTFDVLGLLVRNKDGLRLTEIKQALGLPVSSVHDMLHTMVTAEVLTVTDDLHYSIGPRVVGIALSTVASLDVRTLARRHLKDLAKEVGDDVYLALHLGQRVFYVDRCLGTQRISLDIRLGEPLSLHSTATGKLFAAHEPVLAARALAGPLPRQTASTITDTGELRSELKRILIRGYAKSKEEAVDGIVSYAVPIRHASGALAAAIDVSVIGSRATKAHERKLVAATRECAHQVERGLGHLKSHPVLAAA